MVGKKKTVLWPRLHRFGRLNETDNRRKNNLLPTSSCSGFPSLIFTERKKNGKVEPSKLQCIKGIRLILEYLTFFNWENRHEFTI